MVADFYAMLGADPKADRAALESALAKCQPAWSSGTRNPKNKHKFQSYLDQIPEIRKALLGEPGARVAYDAELAAARRAERDVKLDELQRLVRLRAAKGGLTVADRALLREAADGLGLVREDLDRLTEPIPPKADSPAEVEAVEPAPDVLDAVTRKQIGVTLDHLRRRDLYDALGLARDAPAAEIAARADAERRRWMQKAQVTAEKTAWLEVVSHAQSHLVPPHPRARYDRTLAAEAEAELDRSIAFAVKGLPRLDYGTRAALIDEASTRGITPERADVLIGRGCRALGVPRDAPAMILTSVEPPRYLRCRSCSGLTDFDEASDPSKRPECRHCRAPLQWNCPSCKRVRWVDEPRCVCGFALEHVEPLARHFESAQAALRARDYPAALAHLARVRELAPQHAGARKGAETVRKLAAEADAARARFESARSRRRLIEAEEAVAAWARLAPPDSAEAIAARDETLRAVRMAQGLAARGRAIEADDPATARGYYEKALAIAADLAEAREGLDRSPPEPPSALVAEADGDRVRLRWTPPRPDPLGPVRFALVRKQGGIPSGRNDGATVIETADSEAEDRGIRAGEPVGYAVFAIRGEAASRVGATGGPLAVLPDVADLRVEARSGEVSLSWTLPDRAVGVRAVRNARHRPAHPGDGDPVAALPGGLVDRGLANDRAYHYAVFAVYAPAAGPERASRGAFATAVPAPPAEPIPAPSLVPADDGRVRISWARPARGTVRVIRTTSPLPHQAGERIAAALVAEWPGTWLDQSGGDYADDPSPPPVGICYYTPVIAWAGSATIGHPARYSCVADPSDLRAVRVGGSGRVHLRWRWSAQGAEARVVARAGSPPAGADDPLGLASDVSDEEYSRLGYFAITLPTAPSGPWHLAVFTLAMVQGEEVVSPGLDPSARTVVPGPNPEVTVSYALRRPGFTGRAWSITFRTEPAGAEIPPTALVVHPRTVPLSPDDGAIVARFPASRDGESFAIPPTNSVDLARHRARVFADPGADPDGQPPIRLRHPENGATRV